MYSTAHHAEAKFLRSIFGLWQVGTLMSCAIYHWFLFSLSNRTADHRYYDSARAPEATSATYGYDRIDNRAGYYDQYQYRDYNQGYDYRYSQQHSYIPDYYEQPASIRDRADYSSYYALDTRRGYYDAYGDDWRRRTQDFAYDTAAYTYQNQTLKVETVYPTTPRGGDTATAPLSDRNASSKARLYSFGYRKAARGSILSPKKPSKSADGKPTDKSDTTNSTQVVKEEKPEGNFLVMSPFNNIHNHS